MIKGVARSSNLNPKPFRLRLRSCRFRIHRSLFRCEGRRLSGFGHGVHGARVYGQQLGV